MERMDAVVGPFVAVAAVLAVGGGVKVCRPAATVQALTAVRLPGPALVVRALGAAEMVVGGGAILVGGQWFAAAVTLSYLIFAGFVVVALSRRVMLSSCGCFGKSETPPTLTHVVVNLCSAATAGVAMLARAPGLAVGALEDQPLGGAPFLLLTAAAAYALYLSLAVLPQISRVALAQRQAA